MSLPRLAIIGITGRMGLALRTLAPDYGLKVTSGVSSRTHEPMEGIRLARNAQDLDASQIDVVIDFSLPEATASVISWCKKFDKPLVSGVTGLTDEQKTLFVEAAKSLPVLWAPNMSLGVAVMARMLANLSALDGFEFQIEELHHKRKKDKPSGTAVFLQEKLKEAVGNQVPDPLAIRGGGIFGIHRVWAMGEEEVITLEHNAMDRKVFARGALKAAGWLLQKGPGLYRMDDVLGT